jgi:CubicO group peptidase (beta-lactamase class C family)
MNTTELRCIVGFTLTALLSVTACHRPAGASHSRNVENGLLPAVVIHGQPAPRSMKLADRMAHYHVPGVSIAVINDGKLEWATGYGVLDATDPHAVTAQTLFQAASISKPLTAMAALTLVQNGTLSLDENVNDKLKSWRVPDSEFTKDQKVTLRRLLNHSAGFNVEDVGAYARGESLPTLVQALDGLAPAHSDPIRVQTVPGSNWPYSGGGYSVIQQLLIDVTRMSFPELMQQLVFSKIGMTSSTFQQPLPLELESIAATGHDMSGKPLKGRWYSFPQAAAAGLWTTPTDLARFVIELQESYHGRSNKVLSVEMTRQMLTQQVGGYGLGMWVGGNGNSATFSHPGKNEGFICMTFAYLERGQGAVVMTNGDGGNGLFNEILRAIALEYALPDYRPREKTAVHPDSRLFSSYVGDYDVSGIRTTISANGDKLFVQAPPVWLEPVELYASGGDRFFMLEDDVDVTFVKDAQGNITEMRADASGQTVTAKKVK